MPCASTKMPRATANACQSRVWCRVMHVPRDIVASGMFGAIPPDKALRFRPGSEGLRFPCLVPLGEAMGGH